ncbi:hypothetical protein BDV96DRAFT_573185 [Lophiotrema nucula]|uniref:Uncharacterized protein n=1 Tax=Lophiotrema nucula TaxID=690887 RepID=A0A6A5Z986_9PLEO|nr:hypothetical protein BDV96DRAFT_573185 [Lophiotrema nucula]
MRPLEDGGYRDSQIDLNLCIGYQSRDNGNERFRALSSYLPVNMKTDSDIRNVQLEAPATWRAERTVYPGFFNSILGKTQWEWGSLDLNDYVRNNDGVLEFVVKTESGLFPEWLQGILRKAANAAGKRAASGDPVQAEMEKMRQQIEEEQRLDGERLQKEWLKGTYMEGDLLVRMGS